MHLVGPHLEFGTTLKRIKLATNLVSEGARIALSILEVLEHLVVSHQSTARAWSLAPATVTWAEASVHVGQGIRVFSGSDHRQP